MNEVVDTLRGWIVFAQNPYVEALTSSTLCYWIWRQDLERGSAFWPLANVSMIKKILKELGELGEKAVSYLCLLGVVSGGGREERRRVLIKREWHFVKQMTRGQRWNGTRGTQTWRYTMALGKSTQCDRGQKTQGRILGSKTWKTGQRSFWRALHEGFWILSCRQ